MKIFAVDNYNKKPTFGINLQSKKLRFKEDDFYDIRLNEKSYKRKE